MALTYETYPCDGTVQIFSVTFPYLKREHVKVYLDGIATIAFTWETTSTIRTDAFPAPGTVLMVRRETPYVERSSDFVDSSILDEESLDGSQNELFFIMQESVEKAESTIQKDLFANMWDMQGARVSNAADPVDQQDVVTKAYLEAQNEAIADIQAINQAVETAEAAMAAAQQAVTDAIAGAAAEVADLEGVVAGLETSVDTVEGAMATLQTVYNQAAMDAKADLDSPSLTGTPECPTPTAGTNSQQIANTEFVNLAIAATAESLLHVQDQKAYNIDGGSSVADAWTKRVLNTVVYNDIQDGSLANNEVSLPAGTYYVEARSAFYQGGNNINSVVLGIFKDSVKALNGVVATAYYGGGFEAAVSGRITLDAPGIIDLRYFIGLAVVTSGLGQSNNAGSITDSSVPSIYSDLKIWKIA